MPLCTTAYIDDFASSLDDFISIDYVTLFGVNREVIENTLLILSFLFWFEIDLGVNIWISLFVICCG